VVIRQWRVGRENRPNGKIDRTVSETNPFNPPLLPSSSLQVNGCDYHPYGEFIVSGGDDTNVKVWDVRHKRCIQTYKGHSRYVTDVGFSPDGQWVAR
jgi:WD40 repeat protein